MAAAPADALRDFADNRGTKAIAIPSRFGENCNGIALA
jgi:hypothetical protein